MQTYPNTLITSLALLGAASTLAGAARAQSDCGGLEAVTSIDLLLAQNWGTCDPEDVMRYVDGYHLSPHSFGKQLPDSGFGAATPPVGGFGVAVTSVGGFGVAVTSDSSALQPAYDGALPLSFGHDPGSNDRGWSDPCNEYNDLYKHYQGGIVVKFGTRYQPDLGLGRSFHAPEDYLSIVRGAAGREWHPSYWHLMRNYDPPNLWGRFHVRRDGWPASGVFDFTPDYSYSVRLFCPLFDGVDPAASNAVQRAGTLVHEGFHAHNRGEPGTPWGHQDNPNFPDKLGACSAPTCDDWYRHDQADYAPGELHESNEDHFHHPSYQIEHEFFCDLANYPTFSVVLEAAQRAAGAAKRVGDSRFVNGPIPYLCGLPTPLGGASVLARAAVGGGTCGSDSCRSDADCNSYDFCLAGCCSHVF